MDLSIQDNRNGGDVVVKGNDFELVTSIFNQPYLGLFGGNVEMSTTEGTKDLNQRFDYWGNELFFQEDTGQQFNSNFERELQNVSLTSAGIQKLESVLKDDLKYLAPLGTVTTNIFIDTVDRINIEVFIQEPGQLAEQLFKMIWDGTRIEEIKRVDDVIIPAPAPLAAPTSFAFNTPAFNTLDASLTSNSGGQENGFEWEISTDINFTVIIQTKNTGSGIVTTQFTGLTDGIKYFGRARAKASGGNNSEFSNIDSAFTLFEFVNKVVFNDGVNDSMAIPTIDEPKGNSSTIVGWWTRKDANSSNQFQKLLALHSQADLIPHLGLYDTSILNDEFHAACVFDDFYSIDTITIGTSTVSTEVRSTVKITGNKEKHVYVFNMDYAAKRVTIYADNLGKVVDFTFNEAVAEADIVKISQSGTGTTSNFHGDLIDMHLIKDRKIEDVDEVANIYGNGGGSRWIQDNIPGANIVSHWKYDESSGTTAADETTNNNDWTLVNFAATGLGHDITFSAASGSFTVGKIVTGGTSGTTGIIVSEIAAVLKVKAVNGRFTNTETITESDTGETATVDSVVVNAWDEV